MIGARTLVALNPALVLVAMLNVVFGVEGQVSTTTQPPTLAEIRNLLDSLNITDNYWVRPDLGPTTINMSLGIKSITLYEMQSTVTVSAWLRMEWRDSSRVWSNSDNPVHRAITVLPISKEHIWHPDIVLKNSWAGKGVSLLGGASAELHSDGRIVWRPAALFEAYCQLDLRKWPFERHVCSLHFGSWTLSSKELKIGEISHKLEFPGEQTGEFIVDRVEQTFEERREDGVPEPFDGVVYSIALHREPGTYNAVIFAPAAVVVILCLSTFLMPPRAGEKVILGGVNAVLICLFLIYFAHSLPVLTNQTPFIVVFYSASLYLVCMSLVVAVVVLNISRQQHSTGLPWTAKRLLTGTFGRVLLLSSYIEQIMGVDRGPCTRRSPARSCSGLQDEVPVMNVDMDGQSECTASSSLEIGSKSVSPNLEWLLLAAAVDRVLFVIYSLIFLALAVAFQI